MKLLTRIGAFFGWLLIGPICTACGKDRIERRAFFPSDWGCQDCVATGRRKYYARIEAEEKEARINEQAEAFRRAFPNGPYR